jgi:hypothetical protein
VVAPIPATKVLPGNELAPPIPLTTVLPSSIGPAPIAPLSAHDTSAEIAPLTSAAPPPRQGNLGFVKGFTRDRVAKNLQRAIESFEQESERSTDKPSFEDWIIRSAVHGIDPVHECKLPTTAAKVFKWPRFAELGWKRPLTYAWYGPQPWGEDGYWVAEDNMANEAMVLFAEDLERPLFKKLPQQIWIRWWSEREVDIALEGPSGSLPPISARARALLGPGEPAPREKREWLKMWGERDPESAGTEVLRRLAEPGAATTNLRRSLWQRMFNIVQK